MRKIKFRGWDSESELYRYFGLEHIINTSKGDLIISNGNGFDFRVGIDTVQPFTGLIDKNGKEIYEGDIVKADWCWQKPTLVEIDPYWFHKMIEYALDGELEIIGNIRENPELMK